MNYENKRKQIERYGKNYIGNVIRIVSKTQLIINVGKIHVKKDDILSVYTPESELFDIDGTSLGIYEYVKANLIVIDVSDTYAVCENLEKKEDRSGFLLSLSPLLQSHPKVVVPLNVNEANINRLNIKNKLIDIGDPVKFA